MHSLTLLISWTESAFKNKEKALRERQLPGGRHSRSHAHIQRIHSVAWPDGKGKRKMSEDVLKKYYETFLEETRTPAPPEVQTTYKRHLRAFEDYLEAVQEDMFKQAFQYGYKQGLKAANIELLLQ